MDKKKALKQIKAGDFSLADADKKLKADKEVVLAAVKQYGYVLQYADENLKADKEVVLEAVKQDGHAIEYADKSLKKDKKLFLELIKKDYRILKHADKSLQKEIDPSFLISEASVTGVNLCYNEYTINEKDINSTEKINDFFSDPEDLGYYYTKGLGLDPYESPSEGLVLGILSDNDENKLDSVYVDIDDPDIDINVKNLGKDEFFNCHNTPKKGEIFLTYYFLAEDAAYELKTYKKNKNICIEVESFWKEAIARNMETPEFEFTALGTGGSYDHKLKISFDDGKCIECNNERDEIIEIISEYLINKVS